MMPLSNLEGSSARSGVFEILARFFSASMVRGYVRCLVCGVSLGTFLCLEHSPVDFFFRASRFTQGRERKKKL